MHYIVSGQFTFSETEGLSLTPPATLRFCFFILFIYEWNAGSGFRSPQFFSLKMNWPQAILDLEFVGCMELVKQADKLGAYLYKLCKNT